MIEKPERLRLRKQLLEEKEKLVEAQKLVADVLGNTTNDEFGDATPSAAPVTPSKKDQTTKRANDDRMEIDGQDNGTDLEETPLVKRARLGMANARIDRSTRSKTVEPED